MSFTSSPAPPETSAARSSASLLQTGKMSAPSSCAVSVSNLVANRIWHVNVDGTQNIIDRCRENGARLIFIGSTGAIPEKAKGTGIREETGCPRSGFENGKAVHPQPTYGVLRCGRQKGTKPLDIKHNGSYN